MPKLMAVTTATMLVAVCEGHGYMTLPPSRQYEQYLQNGAGNAEYDPHGIAAGGMYAECDDCLSRGYPGKNPWSAPGTASHLNFVMNGPNAALGVCGASRSADNNYNAPSPEGIWGTTTTTHYRAGEEITVEWCVSADHGGVPMFRLCDDPELVAKLTTPGSTPTVAEMEQIEACFQEGLLRCDSAYDDSQCGLISDCEGHPDWEACEAGKFLHCTNELDSAGKAHACVNTEEACSHGKLARYKLKIPENTPTSAHTVLSFRWDTYENNEVFVGCADISIIADDGTFTPSPTPKDDPIRIEPAPTPRPTMTAEEPPELPPGDDQDSVCCWWSPQEDMCADCQSFSSAGDWCAASADHCGQCGGTWCATDGGDSEVSTPTPSPTPTECADSKTWHQKNKPTNTCSWVAKKPGKRCNKRDATKVFAYEACPVACETCPNAEDDDDDDDDSAVMCTDDADWYVKEQPQKTCEWVSKKPEARCNKANDDKVRSSVGCPVACGTCPS